MTSTAFKSFTYTHKSGKRFFVEVSYDELAQSPLEDECHGPTLTIAVDPDDEDAVCEFVQDTYVEDDWLEQIARHRMMRVLRTRSRFHDALVYDTWNALKQARDEGWGPRPEWIRDNPDATQEQKIVAAVNADYEYLRGFFDGDWHYVVVSVYALDEDGEKIETPHYACGGYESTIMDDETWFSEVVDDAILQIEYERKSIENPGQMSLRFT